jgi:hypothetical protein
MDNIYIIAQEVLVYLGPNDEGGGTALDILSHQRFAITEQERGSFQKLFNQSYFRRT